MLSVLVGGWLDLASFSQLISCVFGFKGSIPGGILFEKEGGVAAVADWSRYRIVAGLVTSSNPVPLKTRRVVMHVKLSRAETSSRWCGVVVRRGECQLRCRPRLLTIVQNYVVRLRKPVCG
ncbi:uncharacterized protein TNCV_959771 [Trichonephila clavipes]|nr:uncharacterized protein TNCV_959771 [Trichonephila clavipes]